MLAEARHHVAKQLQRLGRSDGGDPSHVPDHRALGVEIGGDDQELAALGVFARHLAQDVLADVTGHQLAQSLVAEQAGAEQYPHQARVLQQAFGDP
ncbi:hypothetical protein ACVW1C_000243 [Bradyrhizobium sp. USDA 4011]